MKITTLIENGKCSNRRKDILQAMQWLSFHDPRQGESVRVLFMTETLARVYLQQKNYKKAIKAYEILILKNPEKSGFFADQIRAIKKLDTKEES